MILKSDVSVPFFLKICLVVVAYPSFLLAIAGWDLWLRAEEIFGPTATSTKAVYLGIAITFWAVGIGCVALAFERSKIAGICLIAFILGAVATLTSMVLTMM